MITYQTTVLLSCFWLYTLTTFSSSCHKHIQSNALCNEDGFHEFKAPPVYWPFIFNSVSLVVKDVTLYFQDAYKFPDLLKNRGAEDESTKTDWSGLHKVSEQVKFIKDMLAAMNDKGTPHRVETSDFLKSHRWSIGIGQPYRWLHGTEHWWVS